MTIDTEVAKLALHDSTRACDQAQPGLFGQTGVFDEALRRMKQYDETLLPPHYRRVAENGWTNESFMRHAGQKKYQYSDRDFQFARDVIDMAVARQVRVACGEPMNTIARLCIQTEWLPRAIEQTLRQGNSVLPMNGMSETTVYLHLSDKGPLGTPLFCMVQEPGNLPQCACKNPLYCLAPAEVLPNEVLKESEGNARILRVGNIEVPDMKPVGVRRFNYIFGQPPATFDRIKDALVELNGFPKWRGGELEYSLKEVPLKDAKPTRGALLAWDEAQVAKEAGLFADVKVYVLHEAKVRPKDPVIVGIDHFDQMFPVTYWGGDTPKVVP